MKAVRLVLLIVITAMAVSCNSKKSRPTEKNSIENTQKTDYPPPSENAAEVQIEEVAINPQPLEAENFSADESYQSQRTMLDYNLKNQISAPSKRPMNNAMTASQLQKDSDSLKLHSLGETTPSEGYFKRPQNNIGKIELEEQKEYKRKGSGAGAIDNASSSSLGTSQDNIGPKINIGAKVNKESSDGSKRREIFKEHSEKGHDSDLREIYSRTESLTLSESEFSMPSQGTKNKNFQAGYEPPTETLSRGQNDDIVARQIREAASAEQDPVLREKLWKEYERYRSGL